MVLQHLPCSLSRWRETGVRAAQHLLCPLSRWRERAGVRVVPGTAKVIFRLARIVAQRTLPRYSTSRHSAASLSSTPLT